MTQSAILIVAALLLALMGFWILRSRSGGGHPPVDKTAIAGEAAGEAVRAIPEIAPEAAPEITPVDVGVAARTRPASKIAADVPPGGAAVAGALALTEIGVPAAVGAPDNLRQIKGLGPKLNSLLTALGITRFDQIAAWTEADIAAVDAHLGTFRGRIGRDNWIEQAALLAKGDVAGFEAKFGKLDAPGNS